MNAEDKLALKEARRRFANKYQIVKDGDCVFAEAPDSPLTLISVTDSGTNDDAWKYGCTGDRQGILVAWRPSGTFFNEDGVAEYDESRVSSRDKWQVLPKTWEDFHIYYALDTTVLPPGTLK